MWAIELARDCPDPAAEAAQLAEQARNLLRLGNWSDACSLLEAALLLMPESTDLRQELVHALTVAPPPRPIAIRSVADAHQLLNRRRRAIEHLQRLLHSGADLAKLDAAASQLYLFSGHDEEWAVFGTAISAQCRQIRQREHKLQMQLASRWAKQRAWSNCSAWLSRALADLVPTRRYEEWKKFILQYQDQPGAQMMLHALASGGSTADRVRSVEWQRFAEELLRADGLNANFRSLLQKILARSQPAPFSPSPERPDKAAAAAGLPSTQLGLRLLEVQCALADASAVQLDAIRSRDFWLALDNGMDVFSTLSQGASSIFVMEEIGRAVQIWSRKVSNAWVRSLAWDGRYLWATVEIHQKAPEIWVLDPLTKTAQQLTADVGLPLVGPDQPGVARHVVMAAPLRPGRAILAGGFGRSWLAHAVFDPQGRHQVKVFHEAREVPNPRTLHAWRNPAARFWPDYMFTLSERPDRNDPGRRRVLIGRGANFEGHPLVVDPDKLSVVPLCEPLNNPAGAFLYQGALYYVGVWPPPPQEPTALCLLRMRAPDLTPQPVVRNMKEALLVIHNDLVHVVGQEWWRGRFDGGKLEKVGPVPWNYRNRFLLSGPPETHISREGDWQLICLAPSNHYGVIASFAEGPGGARPTVAQAVFDGSLPALPVDPGMTEKRPQAAAAAADVAPLKPGPPVRSPRILWQSAVAWLSCSPDGKLIVTIEAGSRGLQAWDARDGRLLANLLDAEPLSGPVRFSRDGRLFANATSKGLVVVWSASQMQPLRTLSGPTGDVADLTFSPDGRWLAA